MPGLCKAAAWRLSPGVTVELLNFWQFLCLLCPSSHFKLVSDNSIIYFCIYFRLTLKINEHLNTACQCLKSPLRTFLVGKGSFSKTERTKLRAESHNVQKAKKIEQFQWKIGKYVTKIIANSIMFRQIISATLRIYVLWCSQVNLIVLHLEPVQIPK